MPTSCSAASCAANICMQAHTCSQQDVTMSAACAAPPRTHSGGVRESFSSQAVSNTKPTAVLLPVALNPQVFLQARHACQLVAKRYPVHHTLSLLPAASPLALHVTASCTAASSEGAGQVACCWRPSALRTMLLGLSLLSESPTAASRDAAIDLWPCRQAQTGITTSAPNRSPN